MNQHNTPPTLSSLQQRLQRLRANKIFEWTTVTVILLSSTIIGVKTYALPSVATVALEVLDIVVAIYFVIEIAVRISAEERARDFFKSGWNIFDALIVIASLIPLHNSEYVLLGRLLRLFRVMRLIVFLPQLRELVYSLLSAIPKIAYVALMMFIVFYMYGAFASLMFADINPALWGNIGTALKTLFQIATFDNWATIMKQTTDVYPLSWIFYISFIFFAAFIFLNMMIGVIIEVMHEEHERKLKKTSELNNADGASKEGKKNVETRDAHQQPINIADELTAIRTSLDRLEKRVARNNDR